MEAPTGRLHSVCVRNTATVNERPLLEVRGISKSFGSVQALTDVDFEAHAGQVTALVGDNGAGKSTLVKILSGILAYDAGEYRFEGRPVQVHTPQAAAALGVAQTAQVLELVGRLRERGLGVILISHNLGDVFQVADRIVVLRLGRNAGEFDADPSNRQAVVAAITGAEATP